MGEGRYRALRDPALFWLGSRDWMMLDVRLGDFSPPMGVLAGANPSLWLVAARVGVGLD